MEVSFFSRVGGLRRFLGSFSGVLRFFFLSVRALHLLPGIGTTVTSLSLFVCVCIFKLIQLFCVYFVQKSTDLVRVDPRSGRKHHDVVRDCDEDQQE